jgi:hypothetical protein
MISLGRKNINSYADSEKKDSSGFSRSVDKNQRSFYILG